MSITLEAIHLLEKKIQSLLSNYEFLKEENDILLQSSTNFQQKIAEQEQIIVNQKTSYDLLRIAKTIDGSGTNTRDTKFKINTLIREIDKCIIQLQE
jgi:peptidoglycan hydrolase CwlO-like protein